MRMHYGWVTVAIAVMSYMVIVGSVLNSFGLYVLPVSKELGLSRADMNTAYVLISVGNAVLAMVVGRLLDRYSARLIMTTCAILLGAGFLILSLTTSLWLQIFALLILIPAGVDGGAMITLSVVVARWFKKDRSRAISISTVGLSLGSVTIPPITAFLLQSYGWRSTLEIIGGGLTLFLIAMAAFIRNPPVQDEGDVVQDKVGSLDTAGIQPTDGPASIAQILKMPLFWIIAISCSLITGANAATTISLVPIASAKGLTIIQAASLMTIFGGAAMTSKLILAWISEKFDLVFVATFLFALSVMHFSMIIYAHSYPLFIATALLLGLVAGCTPALTQGLLASRFPIENYGTVRGLDQALNALLIAVEVRVAGEVFDRTGSYDLFFFGLIATSLFSAALIFTARRPKNNGMNAFS